ncbi:MAG: aldo/keto reductase [Myxococcota bacterium]
MRPSALHVAIAWTLAAALGHAGLGQRIADAINGLDPRALPVAPSLAFAAAVIAAAVLTTAWAARLDDGRAPAERSARRRVLVYLGALLAGLGAASAGVAARIAGWMRVRALVTAGPGVPTTYPSRPPAWQGARVRAYRRLGRTGFAVSDVSFGTGSLPGDARGEAIAREAIERGVNYFDTAPDYAGSGTEQALGRAMRGHRDRLFVATKFCTARGHLPAGSPVDAYVRAIEGSLARLGTDRVDLAHVHACDSVDRLLDPNLHEAFDRLRDAGKVRFLGVSSHTPNLPAVADAAIASGRFDVVMLAYHHGAWPSLGAVVERAAAADLGVVAMKTLKGAKQHNVDALRGEEEAYSQAAFKWVLANPNVGCLVISFQKHRHVDEYLHASGGALAPADLALLARYDRATAGTHCRPHCGACLARCPEQLPIDDVLRYRMYFEDYGDEARGLAAYAALPARADACAACSAPCAGACPDGVAIRERMLGAHALLAPRAPRA